MKINSVFRQGEKIPARYTADGENINPPLEISEIPSGAKSLVLIIDDPDAPSGIWVHWILINIFVSSSNFKIEENSIPRGAVQLLNSARGKNYHGPSPPSGTHRYFFKIYALDNFLKISEDKTKREVEKEMQGHILDRAELMGLYSRR